MSVRLAVFDCDGTLVDSQADICAAMEMAFASHDMPAPDMHAVRRLVGLSLTHAIRHLAPDLASDRQLAIVDAYKAAFRAARAEGRLAEPLYGGISDLLADLYDRGWTLGVATGKSDLGLVNCLETHGLEKLFATLQTADRHPSKPHPAMLLAAIDDVLASPGKSVMIGDTEFDIAMAKAAGVRAIGVAWGYHTPDELLGAGADMVAETPEELGVLLK